MSEVVGAWILLAGTLMVAIALILLVVRAFKTRLLWGIVAIATFPFGPLLFGVVHFSKARTTMILLAVGLLLSGIPFIAQRAHDAYFGLGERERWIDGELHLVLTGWDRPDYSILQTKTDVVVLEMGNPDVTDQSLEMLRNLTRLRELTLNDSQVTDEGFSTLRSLPNLETLRLARTKITAEGLKSFLAEPPPSLENIDVSGNQIPASALRKWRNVDPENRRYLN